MHYINHNLRFFRLRNRYTQEELAAKLKTTLGRIKTYETGAATPQIEMIVAIADLMGISLDTLVKVKLDENNYQKEGKHLTVKGSETPTSLQERVSALEAITKAITKQMNIASQTKKRTA